MKEILLIIGLIVGFRRFFFDMVRVSDNSMLPTIRNHDRLFVDKVRYLFHVPDYGEVVIIKASNTSWELVKRVIGKGGDIIEIRNQVLYRNR